MAGQVDWPSTLEHHSKVWKLRSDRSTESAKATRKQADAVRSASPVKAAALDQEADNYEAAADDWQRRAKTAANGYWPMHQRDTVDTKFQREYSELGNAAVRDGRARLEGFSDEAERMGAEC